MDVTSVPWKTTRYPGVAVHFYHSDRETGRAAVLIRMDAGCGYPRHRHKGSEEVLVVQGGYRDEEGVYREGEFVRYEDGTVHSPVALPEGPCVLFAISAEGIDLLGGPGTDSSDKS